MLCAGEFTHGLVRGCEKIVGVDGLRHGQVITGLRFLHVGDGDQPDIETLLGLLQLPRDASRSAWAKN